LGFEVHGVPPVELDGQAVSSTRVREAVTAGRVDRAAELLGRPFALSGEVLRGDGRGRDLGFPTANLSVENELIPARGVYITRAHVLASSYSSVTNVGVRPTIGGSKRVTVETHLLEFDDDVYDERMTVEFLHRLRDEVRFDDVAQLADQIARDRAATESFFINRRLGA
jgi:riboflavin kinase/FMN adenylyltransferase